MPAMRALKRLGVDVSVLCPERQTDFWEASSFGKVTGYSERASVRELAGRLKEAKASLAWEEGTAADAMAKAGIPRRLGPPAKGLVKRLTEPVEVIGRPGPVQHRVRFYLGLVEKLGAQAMVAENFAPLVTGTPRAMERVLLVPDSDFGPHFEWPVERWEAVAKDLLERGKQLWIATAGPKGAALAKALPAATGVALAFPGLDDLSSCALCIAADGSVPHLAAHVGTTCAVPFRPRRAGVDAPAGQAARHRAAESRVLALPRAEVPDGPALPERPGGERGAAGAGERDGRVVTPRSGGLRTPLATAHERRMR